MDVARVVGALGFLEVHQVIDLAFQGQNGFFKFKRHAGAGRFHFFGYAVLHRSQTTAANCTENPPVSDKGDLNDLLRPEENQRRPADGEAENVRGCCLGNTASDARTPEDFFPM